MDATNIAAIETRMATAACRLSELESAMPTPGWAADIADTRANIDTLHAELDRAMGVTS